MKNGQWIRVGIATLTVVLLAAGPAHAVIVLSDTLQGSTTGTRSGGTFVAGGWRVDGQYNWIYWHIAPYAKGAFEYDVRGLPNNSCPGGAGFKNEVSHMYDYTFGNADVVYSGGYRDDPYKQFLRKQCDAGKMNTMEILWQIQPNFREDDTGALSWDVNTTYTFRNEWENTGGNAICRTYRNGVLILSQSVSGSWTPGGQSIRIAASPRQADEGATTNSIYSNVTAEDMTSAIPGAPTIVAPTNAETVNTNLVYVQWSGETHTLYQMRINLQNNPDNAVVYDSQQVSSNRFFAWTGVLSDNTAHYAFVRMGTTSGWGPWSAGRLFTVNTSFVPGGIDYVKVKGNTYVNNSGPFLGLGFSYFRTLQRCKYDRPRMESDLAFMATKKFNYQRMLSMVAWDDVEIAPVTFTNCVGQNVPAWPDYAQQFKDCIDIAYGYGIKTEVTIFADAQCVMPNDSTRTTHLSNVLAYLVGREHKVVLLEVGNELWQNGLPDANDVRAKGAYLAANSPIPVALSAPADASDGGIVAYYGGSDADIATVHFSRNLGTAEGGWLPVRDCYRTGVIGVAPMSSNEPIGPGSSVATENDPIKLCMAGIFAWTANLTSYVFHSKAGVQSWTSCCPPSGTQVFFNTTSGVDSYEDIFPQLPKDLASWERNDGKAAASPFTNYSMGQANKWWTEVGGATNGCIRNIAAIKGGEFVTCPIGILGGGLELEARRPMNFQVYDPLTGAVAYNLTKNTGDHFTLVQGPQAYVIKGIFTDILTAATEVSIDLGNPDVQNNMTHPQPSDGDTVSFAIGGRTGKKNVNAGAGDYYFYFGVGDAFAYQGSKQDLYIAADYYDTGTSTLTLEYDATAAAFTNGGGVTLTNTNIWKSKVWHVTDAYFGNRQNSGADFRIGAPVGVTFYLDFILVSTVQPGPPIIAEVSPDPDPIFPGVPYTAQLALIQGSPAPTWSVVQGPAGLQVNASGLVSGWTPSSTLGDYTLEIQATNSQGSDTEVWTVRVLSIFDFDFDGDSDSSDFGHLQECLSGDTIPYGSGCGDADSNGDGDVDNFDFNAFLPCMGGPNNLPGC